MKTLHKEPCYCCGQKTSAPYAAYTEDDGGQEQLVGRECFKQIKAAGAGGWKPSRGGPRMFAKRTDAIAYKN